MLYAHLYKTRARNATYLSPTSHNQIVSVIGHDIVRAYLLAEVKKAIFFAVLADEVCSHNVEYLPLCLCFVDERCNIREEFVAFIKLERVRAIDIANAIVSMLEELGLSLNDLRGQGYDGSSTMRGEKSSVQKQLLDRQSKALYTHCAGHSFNLALVSSCTIPCVRNIIEV